MFLSLLACEKSWSQQDCKEFKLEDFTFNGNAHIQGEEAVLTQASNAQFGAIWANERINLNDDFVFETEMYFGTNSSGADGIAFVLQPLSNNQGAQGGGIGYQGIMPSIAIEFDTYYNGGTDPMASDHIAVVRDGLAQNLPAHSEFVLPYNAGFLKNGNWYEAIFEWIAPTQTFQLTFNGTIVFSFQIDLVNEIFGGQTEVYWGFTSATGGANNLHKIKINNYCITPSLCESVTDIEASNNNICVGEEIILHVDADPALNPIFLWSTGESGSFIMITPEFTSTYFVEVFIEDVICYKEITIDVKYEVYPPLGDGYQTFCNDPVPTVADIVITDGENIKWYDSPYGGFRWDDGQELFSGQILYASQTIDGCESKDRLMVLVEIFEPTMSETYIQSCQSVTWNHITYHYSGNYDVNLINENGCDSIAYLFLTIEEEINVEFEISACESYFWNNNIYTESGVYIDEFVSYQGCDSFAILNLEILKITSDTLNIAFCGEYIWNGQLLTASGTYHDTLLNIAGCDSIVVLDLEILNGNIGLETITACGTYFWEVSSLNYTETGVYSDTLTNVYGCDSILILDLNILSDSENIEVVTACDSYVWSVTEQEYFLSGEYRSTLISSSGCDSILIIELNILKSQSEVYFAEACNSYFWETSGFFYTQSGQYSEILTGINGCDSVVILDLIINESYEFTESISTCEAYIWPVNGHTYTESGYYTENLLTINGCDSILHLDLIIFPREITLLPIESCNSYYWNTSGMTYEESGNYSYTLTSSEGCDSIVTLVLLIYSSSFTEENISVCETFIWSVNGQEYTQSGVYSEMHQNIYGCDSLIVLNLTVQNSEVNSEDVAECDFYIWPVNGVTYVRTGTYDHMLSTVNGCDSLMILNLEIFISETVVEPTESCGSFTWAANGQTYLQSGRYAEFLQTINGCDSIAILELEILPISENMSVMAECDEYVWPVTGQVYTQSGTYTEILTNSRGCDSILILDLSLNHSMEIKESMEACGSYHWPVTGENYFESGSYARTLISASGCDSIITLNLEINENFTDIEVVGICDEYTWPADGNTYYTSGVYSLELQSSHGCDSILLLELNVEPSYEYYDEVSVEDEYYWPITRQTYKESGVYSHLLQTEEGCDSLRVLLLDITKREIVFVPNSFSPNGDGVNDLLTVFATSGIEKIDKFQIFDRWGALVFTMENFSPNDGNRGWDGNHRSKFAGVNVFVYSVEYTNIAGHKKIVKGDVTLIK